MGSCTSRPPPNWTDPGTDKAFGGMSQGQLSAKLNRSIATKLDRIPPLDRTRVWTAAEVAALSRADQASGELTHCPFGIKLVYPATWQLVGSMQAAGAKRLGPMQPAGVKRYEWLVRTGHLFKPNHMRTTAEVGVGIAPFNTNRPTDAVTEATFAQFSAQLAMATNDIPGGKLLLNETLPANAFKASRYSVTHSVSTFEQSDQTTSRAEQWLMLSEDRTSMCVISLFSADLSCWEKYGAMQTRVLESITFTDARVQF